MLGGHGGGLLPEQVPLRLPRFHKVMNIAFDLEARATGKTPDISPSLIEVAGGKSLCAKLGCSRCRDIRALHLCSSWLET